VEGTEGHAGDRGPWRGQRAVEGRRGGADGCRGGREPQRKNFMRSDLRVIGMYVAKYFIVSQTFHRSDILPFRETFHLFREKQGCKKLDVPRNGRPFRLFCCFVKQK
jgi:hypothetical protein